ncbi:histidinol-phosphatase [Labilibacter marinus]|uniref:histidinol-phosphatase n=1 Tax=Labilibacter marinus TaxID=1477105 RepID=UPI00082FBBE7|nr:histidinol-phosphatase [Labilibacter marinus]
MGWTNYHGHCKYCDGHGEIETYILQAIENKMPAIGISSHAPVPFDCFWTMKQENLHQYLSDIGCLEEKYGSGIDVLTSLEIDYIPDVTGPDFPFLKDIKLDYKIGSIHFVDQFQDGEHWAIDGSFDEFKKGLDEIFNGDIKTVVQRFYHLNREMLKTQKFDIIGHFDKIKMHNATEPLFDENEEWYKQELNETLDCIKENNVIVEINTKSFERNGLLFPGVELFSIMLEKGIDITINSDAHYPEKLQVGYEYVADELIKAGYKTLKEYKNKTWVNVPFTKDGLQW